MPRLRSLVHVSTAFVNINLHRMPGGVAEQVYPLLFGDQPVRVFRCYCVCMQCQACMGVTLVDADVKRSHFMISRISAILCVAC